MKVYLKKILEWIQKYHNKRIKREELQKLITSYEEKYQVELVLEQWIIKRILDGQTGRRKELAEKQSAIKEMSEFINYLKKLKI